MRSNRLSVTNPAIFSSCKLPSEILRLKNYESRWWQHFRAEETSYLVTLNGGIYEENGFKPSGYLCADRDNGAGPDEQPVLNFRQRPAKHQQRTAELQPIAAGAKLHFSVWLGIAPE